MKTSVISTVLTKTLVVVIAISVALLFNATANAKMPESTIDQQDDSVSEDLLEPCGSITITDNGTSIFTLPKNHTIACVWIVRPQSEESTEKEYLANVLTDNIKAQTFVMALTTAILEKPYSQKSETPVDFFNRVTRTATTATEHTLISSGGPNITCSLTNNTEEGIKHVRTYRIIFW